MTNFVQDTRQVVESFKKMYEQIASKEHKLDCFGYQLDVVSNNERILQKAIARRQKNNKPGTFTPGMIKTENKQKEALVFYVSHRVRIHAAIAELESPKHKWPPRDTQFDELPPLSQ
jgi:hypothetical protein